MGFLHNYRTAKNTYLLLNQLQSITQEPKGIERAERERGFLTTHQHIIGYTVSLTYDQVA